MRYSVRICEVLEFVSPGHYPMRYALHRVQSTGNRGWICAFLQEPAYVSRPARQTRAKKHATRTTPGSYAALRISNSTLAFRPPRHPSSCGSRWPRAPQETTRRTVKDDWPDSHPADLRSRHAILWSEKLLAHQTSKTQFYKKESSRPEKNTPVFSSAISFQPFPPPSIPVPSVRTTPAPTSNRLLRLSASPQPPHAQCLNTSTRPSPHSALHSLAFPLSRVLDPTYLVLSLPLSWPFPSCPPS
ncbi:hypothetical protein QBC39DRAFT_183830 [Podospora conica]|nr:hypothetical protein QBC39DRAFT_183830 [Schizothecium conicum]